MAKHKLSTGVLTLKHNQNYRVGPALKSLFINLTFVLAHFPQWASITLGSNAYIQKRQTEERCIAARRLRRGVVF